MFSSYSLLALHSGLLAVGSLGGSIKLLALNQQGEHVPIAPVILCT